LEIFEQFCVESYEKADDPCLQTRLDVILAKNVNADHLKQALLESKGGSFLHVVSEALSVVVESNREIPTEYRPAINN